MKILVVSQYYYPEPFRINDICETLVKRGHSVTVLTAQPNYPEGQIYSGYTNKYQFEQINGVSVYRTKIHPRKKGSIHLFLNYISFPFYSRKVLRKLDMDFELVFINQLSPIFSAIPGIKYAKKHKIKSILYCLDLWPESLVSGGIRRNSLVYKIIDIYSKKIYKMANKILVTSKSFINKFSKYHITAEYLPQYAEEIFQSNEHYKKNDDKFRCTFAGNIGDIQSVETILYAANQLKDFNDIIFEIYGTGSKIDYIKSIKNDLKLNNVNLYGRRDISDMPGVYAYSDIMLVTLKRDDLLSMTLPGKVQTYLAAGKPIIGAVDGETKIIIEESKAGFICQAEDYVKLSELILIAKRNHNIKNLGVLGKNYYHKNFSKDIIMDKLDKIFEEVKNVQ